MLGPRELLILLSPHAGRAGAQGTLTALSWDLSVEATEDRGLSAGAWLVTAVFSSAAAMAVSALAGLVGLCKNGSPDARGSGSAEGRRWVTR